MHRYILSTRHTGFDGDAVSNLQVRHLPTDLHDCACALVAQNDGAFENKVADAPPLPVVHIAAANPGLLYVDSHVMLVPKLRNLAVLKRNILNRLQHESRVLAELLALAAKYNTIGNEQ